MLYPLSYEGGTLATDTADCCEYDSTRLRRGPSVPRLANQTHDGTAALDHNASPLGRARPVA